MRLSNQNFILNIYIYMTLKFKDVQIDNLSAKIYNKHLLINYEKQNLTVQSDWMNLSHYEVPKSKKNTTQPKSQEDIYKYL